MRVARAGAGHQPEGTPGSGPHHRADAGDGASQSDYDCALLGVRGFRAEVGVREGGYYEGDCIAGRALGGAASRACAHIHRGQEMKLLPYEPSVPSGCLSTTRSVILR